MAQTVEQRRAQIAWERAKANSRFEKEYVSLAKGAPALVMGNGLMPALAYWQSRGKGHATALCQDVLVALHDRMKCPQDFEGAMRFLQDRDSRAYMQATEEALEFLKWLRQFADSLARKN
ncbi:MAG: type III-B CRISPR module-associated protein Cmr5 [Candidatus Sericytochromatia bacterium]|uniref:CRISPR type III-B/RAMP module-associated protein Cmr5 n=1 Tax=Candidatus Tanganyikabacteria bacterium TaxID=2961651 RepID=A0A937XA45_9BACT|nr:type III-B CRISPR module-associated protein Cmr5 [Candidatus Tanganyikabacteria bacterium]